MEKSILNAHWDLEKILRDVRICGNHPDVGKSLTIKEFAKFRRKSRHWRDPGVSIALPPDPLLLVEFMKSLWTNWPFGPNLSSGEVKATIYAYRTAVNIDLEPAPKDLADVVRAVERAVAYLLTGPDYAED